MGYHQGADEGPNLKCGEPDSAVTFRLPGPGEPLVTDFAATEEADYCSAIAKAER